MSRDIWNPAQYRRYAVERARPFHDLTARIAAVEPSTVVDLGCGPGELTGTLARRWPGAEVTGVDSSTAMIERAAAVPGITARIADVTTWRPPRPPDVVVANAVFQWVPDHDPLLTALAAGLAPGGWFAFQMPGNFGAPSHVLLRQVCRSERWRDRVGALPRDAPVAEPGHYLELLAGAGRRVDVWETTYLHLLPGDDPVLEWVRGTALRPVLTALTETERAAFLADYGAELRAAYPRGEHGTVLPFRRIFVVAHDEGGR